MNQQKQMYECRYSDCDYKSNTVSGRGVHESSSHGAVYTGEWDNEEYLRDQYHGQGKSMKEIAEEHGASYNRIRERIKHYGIETRGSNDTRYFDRRTKLEDDKEEIIKLYTEEKLPMYEVAERYGVNDATIQRYLESWGIETRDIQNQHLANTDYPQLNDEDWLYTQYREKRRYVPELAKEIGCSENAVYQALLRHGIEIFPHGETIKGEQHARWKGGDAHKVCEQCGCEYTTPRVYAQTQRFCSPGCRGSWMSEELSGPNWPNWSGGPTHYYGTNWDSQREKRILKDDEQCKGCGLSRDEHYRMYGSDLEVHHIIPRSEFHQPEEANKLDNLITFCKSCHKLWEGIPVVPK